MVDADERSLSVCQLKKRKVNVVLLCVGFKSM